MARNQPTSMHLVTSIKDALSAGVPILHPRSNAKINLEILVRRHPELSTGVERALRAGRRPTYIRRDLELGGRTGKYCLELWYDALSEDDANKIHYSDNLDDLKEEAAHAIKLRSHDYALISKYNRRTREWLNVEVAYDASHITSAQKCCELLQVSKEREIVDVFCAVLNRLYDIVHEANEEPTDPLIGDLHATLACYEQILRIENGRNPVVTRVLQRLTDKSVEEALISWTLGNRASAFFKVLVKAGFAEFSGEFLILKYADRVPERTVQRARRRLQKHGVPFPLKR